MRNLVYYYPLGTGAPSEVSRRLFSALANKNLPFNISIFPQRKIDSLRNISECEKFSSTEIYQIKNLLQNYDKKLLIHFTMSPLVFPNRRFILYLISLLNRNKLKLIINYHGELGSELKQRLKGRDIESLIYIPNYLLTPYIMKSADSIVVNSLMMKSLFETKYKVKNIVVIPNGIDSSWLSSKRSIKKDEKDTKYLFYHGRLAPEKGVEILIKSLSNILKTKNLSLKLLIAGDGEERDYLEKLCNDLEIKNEVTFLGKISQSEIKSYLSMVDAAIYPSLLDAFSLSVLEAFSTVNGPVMYSNKIGINDFVRRDGFEFHTFNPSIEGVTNCLSMVAENNYNQNIFIKQKKFASNYTWDRIADEYIKLYYSLL
ncbi:glycosyltransferase family 4 protein [Methanosarcina mazei]|uniref:Uncharacterized protein n=1 Tax=Methanosarcina mazei TaxID=2209 RepID=A0A0F8EVE6_METMZ|nr:glycosyltransferase family 4 protein [Methanosarcina mazei]KKG11800.1 hypothetical protein DU34_04185 [Methanosarcina mazei]